MLIAIIKDATKIKPKSSRLSEYDLISIEEFKGALIAKMIGRIIPSIQTFKNSNSRKAILKFMRAIIAKNSNY